jgi:hypothetical protein
LLVDDGDKVTPENQDNERWFNGLGAISAMERHDLLRWIR